MELNNLSFQKRRWEKWLLRVLILLGIIALANYLRWWLNVDASWLPLLLPGLLLIALYSVMQILGSWYLYLALHDPPLTPPVLPGHTVDAYVTAYHEPVALVEGTLAATVAMRGAHRTWLLDDGSDPALAELAFRLGAGYLTRTNHRDAKAGNINAALARTKGDILVIFDVDHIPGADFLEKTLGFFRDPAIGFVQVMPTFYNGNSSWVASAAAESSFDFYNPISFGMNALGSPTLMGSNALLRRAALDSINGYQSGLAEDLATSISIHAKGWKSVYVAEPLAPGLAPADLGAWFTQQLKWARGVFEILVTLFPRYWHNLEWSRRLSYAVRTSNYILGLIVFLHLLLTLGVMLSENQSAALMLTDYWLALAPLALLVIVIRSLALHLWHHESLKEGLVLRGIILICATWPIYTIAAVMAILRVPLSFQTTPKSAGNALSSVYILPQFTITVLLGVCIVLARMVQLPSSHVLILFAALQMIPQAFIVGVWASELFKFRTGQRTQHEQVLLGPTDQ